MSVRCPPDARPPASYVDGLSRDVARARAAGSIEAAIQELVVAAFSYAFNLTVGPDFLDGGLLNLARVERHLRDGTDLLGRWHSSGAGYVYVNETGTAGRSSRAFPDDVDPATVVAPPSVSLAVPGRARLCAILQVLASEQIPPSLAAAARSGMTAARNAIESSTEGRRDSAWRHWRGTVLADYEAGRSGPLKDAVDRPLGQALRDGCEAMYRAYRSLNVDAHVASLAVILLELHQAIRRLGDADPTGRHPPAAERIGLVGLGPAGSARGEAVFGAIRVALRDGHRAAVLQAAERCRLQTDELIERALDGGVAIQFLAAVHATLPMASATVHLLDALRDTETDPRGRDRSARAANAAEERLIRLYDSVFRAAHLREAPLITWDRERIAKVRATQGAAAANDLVAQLIEFQYFYPRAMRRDLVQGRPV